MSRPAQCAMPDLTALDSPVMGNYTLNLTFGHARITDRLAVAYVVNFIRMTDKALSEYQEARHALQSYVERRESMLAVIRSVDHLETCVNAVKRGLNYLDRMRRHKNSPNVPRTLWNSLRQRDKTITNIRDLVEHMDEAISEGEVREGQPKALAITEQGDAAEIGEYRLAFSDLANTIRYLHNWASDLAQYNESKAGRC